ncbi:hypothetical protein GCM10023264_03280 [Sphingomonas daechungensis]|uniref:DUF2207 domain-containing protein n=1 Tax=Sphingomonas daechungensis TaxID=1176646 RepID=A0ABX6SYW3_9SPHN|nr:hypothetical protein [Sphingomonas daechungensis]QNP42761.1 hypothetical protein H9L15_11685 [Sphingomonas daechungensis]
MSTERFDRVIQRADRVMRQLDERDGAVREAARRERQRLNSDLARRVSRVGVAIGVVSLITIIVGLIQPIGMFGFLAAVGIAIGIAALLGFMPSGKGNATAPAADLPNGAMVQRFDSYLYRQRGALPAPARAEIDAISRVLPSLKQTLERIDDLNPDAQDARRLMSVHLPGLIDRYINVPAEFRSHKDGEDVTVDERLVEGLHAGRDALAEVAERLARSDVAAFETQGRFIQSRYGEDGQQLLRPGDSKDRDMIES